MLSKTAVKYIQSLSFKKFRDENDLFVAEGPKVVEELIASGRVHCKCIYGLEAYLSKRSHQLESTGIEVNMVTEAELEKISSMKTPNQVIGIFKKFITSSFKKDTNKITLVLDGINDPGNMGTIIRIADWFGIEDIICSLSTVDMYNPKVVQSSMASLARVNVRYCDLASFFEEHKGTPVIATTLNGDNVFNVSVKGGFLVIGNEANGISADIISTASMQLSIPRIGTAESLNAAVAAGIVLGSLLKDRLS